MSIASNLLEKFNKIVEKYPSEISKAFNIKKVSDFLSEQNIDIERSDFRLESISSGRDPKLKSPDYYILWVFKVLGRYEVAISSGGKIIPKFNIYLGSSKHVDGVSWKYMIDNAEGIYAIDIVDNSEIKKSRAERKAGAINLDRDKRKQRRSKNGTWFLSANHDKSGYKIDRDGINGKLFDLEVSRGDRRSVNLAIDLSEEIIEYQRDLLNKARTGSASSYIEDLSYLIRKIYNSVESYLRKLDSMGSSSDSDLNDFYRREAVDSLSDVKDTTKDIKVKFEDIKRKVNRGL